ncbi:hypothetical protein ABPG72_004722 [Tetrahymena utriculariae]
MEIEIEEKQEVLQNRNKLQDLQKCDVKNDYIVYLISHIMKFSQNLTEIQLDSQNSTSIVLKAKNTFDNSYVAVYVCDIKKQNYKQITSKIKKLGVNLIFEHILDSRLLYQIFDYYQYQFASKTLQLSQINEQNFTLVKSALVEDEQLDQDLLEIINNLSVVEKLQKCVKLEKLNLNLNFLQLNQKYLNEILNIDSFCFNLTDLKIGLIQSGIQDFLVKEIAEALVKYQKLQNLELKLCQNPISENSIFQILSRISQLPNLEDFVLDLFELQKLSSDIEDDFKIQQSEIQISNSIKHLKIDLSCNKYLSQHSFYDLINLSLGCSLNLVQFYLDLSKTPISNDIFSKLIKDLSKQTQLRSLNLRLVNLAVDLSDFKDSLIKLTEVEKFVIQLDKSITSCLNLFEGLKFFKKLKHLEVVIHSNYKPNHNENLEIPCILRQLNSLQYLVLNFNSLTGVNYQQQLIFYNHLEKLKYDNYYFRCIKVSHLVKVELFL